MNRIELIYDVDCPNVSAARHVLGHACRIAGCKPEWIEWERSLSDAPVYVMTFGSPTILVDGSDVAGDSDVISGSCCRIYARSDGGYCGIPSLEQIIEALRRAIV